MDALFLRATSSERRAAGKHMQRARDEYRGNKRKLDETDERLQRHIRTEWATPLHDIDVLRLEAEIIGALFHSAHGKKLAEGRTKSLASALIAIHARACLTASEIVCLARSGHSQGAFARLRTLSELSAFSSFILRHGEETARRFCDYGAIEVLRREKAARADGHSGMTEEAFAELEKTRVDLVARYGQSFVKDYGWASHAFGGVQVRLTTILGSLNASGNVSPVFRDASMWVHSSTVGVFTNIQMLRGNVQFITGPNDERLGIILHGTSVALLFTSVNLLPFAPKDKDLRARGMSLFRLAESARESATLADEEWLRRRPDYRKIPSGE